VYVVGYGQATPTCTTTSTSWYSEYSYSYGIDAINIAGYAGSTLTDFGITTSCDPTTGYLDETTVIPAVSLQQGTSYSSGCNVTWGTTSSYQFAQVWIDFNDNGTFEVTEEVTPVFGYNSLSTTSPTPMTITIPLGAPIGTHLMRVRGIWEEIATDIGSSPADVDPCALNYGGVNPNYYSGTCVDYHATIVALPSCSGAPSAGTTTADVTTACPGVPFNLGIVGYSGASDFTYQWMSSTDGVLYSAIAGATNPTYSATISTPTYFELIITCPSSGLTGTSTPVFVNYVGYCYCVPNYYYSSPAAYYAVSEFFVNEYGGATFDDFGPSSIPSTGYEDITTDTLTFQQGQSYAGYVNYSSYDYYENQVWIDYNGDGIFDISEEVTPVFGNPGTYAGGPDAFTLTIPMAIADTGYHRMRLRNAEFYGYMGTSADMDPCNDYDATGYTYYYGVTRDYTVHIIPLPPCSGTPVAGVTASTVTTGCPGIAFGLSVTGASAAVDFTYQWSSSTDGVIYSPIAGATNLTYSPTISTPTYFELTITCPTSGMSATSTPVFVNYVGYCYCVPSYYYSSPGATYAMSEFDVAVYGGGTFDDFGPATIPSSGFEDITHDTLTFQQGQAYAGYVNYANYDYYENQVWIDYNNDGVFDISEEVTPVFGSPSSYTSGPANFTLTIPMAITDTGYHRMRVRNAEFYGFSGSSADMDPCNDYDASGYTYYYGLARDYTVHIIPLPPCSGTPTAGVTASTASTACPGVAFGLSVTGASIAGDYTYQWSSSTDGVAYSPIAGATNLTYSPIIATPTYFELTITCPTSGMSATSTPVFVNYVGYCFCVPTYYYSPATSYGYGVDEVSVTGYGGTSLADFGPATPAASGFEDQTIDTVSFQQSGAYPITVSYTSGGEYENQVWIDFNNDGIFDISEEVTTVFSTGGSYSFSPSSGTINIPFTAATGYHRMRVRDAMTYGGLSTDMDPCNNTDGTMTPYYDAYYYGMTRDYTVNIIPLPPCSGAPSVDSAHADVTLACPSTPFNLSVSGLIAASDLTFQWLSSTDGISYSAISGATSLTYSTSESAPTYYELKVTCPTSTLSDTSVAVFVNYLGYCYCVPSYYYAPAATYEGFTNFTVAGFGGTLINDNGPAVVPASGYEDRTTISATMQAGGSYAGTITYTNAEYDPYSNQIWIDFSDNGVFEASEEVTPVFGPAGCGSYDASDPFTINIPVSANPGMHRMRVRNAFYYSCTPSSEMDPCADYDASWTYYYGLSRDYMINIVPLCPYSSTVLSSLSSVCPNTDFSLSATTGGTSYTWTGPGGFSSTLLNPTVTGGITTPGTYTFTATDGTCVTTLTTYVGVLPAPPAPIVLPADTAICSGSSVLLTATVLPDTINLIPAESWEHGIPTTAGTAVDGWNTDAPATTYFTDVTSYSYPTVSAAEDGTHFAVFRSFYYPVTSGASANLISPSFNMTGVTGGQISFWVYREVGGSYPCSSGYCTEGWNLLINTTSDPSSATNIGFVPRAADASTTGVTGTSMPTTSGWYQYTISIPSTYTGTSNYIFFQGYSNYGDNCYLDNVTVRGAITIPAPTWTPSATLYSDAGLTTPYVAGTPATTVYALPTGGASPIITDYVATVTDGTCTAKDTSVVTTNPGPAITGTTSVCASGGTTTLTPATTGGTWSTVDGSIATVVGGVVTGHNVGTTTLSYVLPSGCYSTTTITVNPLPTAITGTMSVCGVGATTTLSSGTGGTWSGGAPAGSIDASGVFTASAVGTGIVSYTLPVTGCYVTASITVNPLPSPISGATAVCEGSSITLTDVSAGTWSVTGPTGTIISSGGVLTGGTATGTATATYTAPVGGCYVTYPVTVNVTPAPIGGSSVACVGSSVTLTDAVGGGTWTATPSSTAIIDGTTGMLTGEGSGTATVSYTIGSCAVGTTITVNTPPPAIVGLISVCASGGTITLTDASTVSGTWSISGAAASITPSGSSAVVTGSTAGTAVVSYTIPGGCYVTSTITVNPLPAPIGGATTVCLGLTAVVTDASAPGTWAINPSAVAIIDATGTVTGLGVGSAITTFTSGTTGCSVTAPLTVSPLPLAITTPTTVVCVGATITLADGTPSGTWGASPAGIVSVDASGDVLGVSAGTALVSYEVGGCSVNTTITVSPIVTPGISISATPGTTVCAGAAITFTATPSNGGPSPFYQWTVNSVNVGTSSPVYTYIPANGDVVGCTMVTSLPCATTSSATTNVTITVDPIVTPVANVYAVPGTPIISGTLDTFAVVVSSGAGSAPTYQWYVNGVAISGATNLIYVDPSLANGDSVTCKVTNNDPCGGSATPSSGVITVYGVGVNNVTKSSGFVTVVPNPNNGTFLVKGNVGIAVDEDVRLVITDMLGQVVFNDMTRTKNGVIEQPITLGNNLANGMYILDVRSEHVSGTFHFILTQ